MPISDREGNVAPTGPTGPAEFRWTYLRLYGAGERYSADLYRSDGLDTVNFLKVGEKVPWEAQDGTLDLDFSKEELDKVIAELVWLRDNWGKVGREAN